MQCVCLRTLRDGFLFGLSKKPSACRDDLLPWQIQDERRNGDRTLGCNETMLFLKK